ncbi:AAA family ATPase [Streptomyces actuosus]|uniref:AAA family ATPase n=1 Tax=Streptomyces actuosus TaxID=1885 RepID=A0ABS2W0D4_STRAS|nr:AAA family ATPase [Streptomyces actuosus]MBN0048585.1 AAA family ATPase [Streptomyces actuosus]
MALLGAGDAKTAADEAPPRLVGRDTELSLIREQVKGAGRAVLLRGPAGIGKTRLMRAAIDAATEQLDADTRVLTAKCPENGSSAYEVVRALFTPLRLTEGHTAGHPLLRGSARLALPALIPGRTPDATPADVYAVMQGLYWLTAGLAAERPVVLAVDDLQWCDEASLRWLGFLLRRAKDLPVVLVLTLRTEAEEPLPAALEEMADIPSCLTLDVHPLGEDDVGDLLAHSLGDRPEDELVASCMQITGGTPFLVHLLADRWKEQAPLPDADQRTPDQGADLGLVARFQIDRLTAERLSVARAVAVLEEKAVETVAALAGVQPDPARRVVEELRAAGLLRPDSLTYRHDLIREAVLQTMRPAERTELYERAARLLDDTGRPAEEIAVQLLRLPGTPDPWMVTALRSAALGAELRGAPATAGKYLSRALRHDPHDLELLSHAARVFGHIAPGTALRHLEHALSLPADHRTRCRLVLQYGVTSLGAHNSLRAFDLVNETLDLTARELGTSPADRALRARVEAMVLISGLDETSTVARVSRRFRDRTPPLGETADERVLLGMLCALRTLEGRPAPVSAAERVLRLGDGPQGGWGVLGAALTLYLADVIPPVDTALTAVLDQAQSRGEAWRCALVSATRAQVHLWAGNVTRALSDAQFSHDLLDRELRVETSVTPQCTLAAVHVQRGEPERAQHLLDLIRRPRLEQFTLEYHAYLMALARTRAALGDLGGAREHLLRCGDSLAAAGIGNPVLAPWWFDAAQVLARLGREHEGLDILERVAASVEEWGTARAHGMLCLARGVLTPGDAGLEFLTEAAELLVGSPARLEHARAEYFLGRRLSDRGDARGARIRLHRSIDVAVLCGDKLLLDEVRPVLGAARGRLRQGTTSPAESLSGGERQVAERAAAGATNREIAEALFLTQRTVEFHLTSVYRKLGIRGRHQIAAALTGDPTGGGSARL